MTKYIAIQIPEYKVYSIVDVEDVNTLDGIDFPENISLFIPAKNVDVLPEIGQIYNPELNKFE